MLFLREAPRSLCLETASECNSSDPGNGIINIPGRKKKNKNLGHIGMERLMGGWLVPVLSTHRKSQQEG